MKRWFNILVFIGLSISAFAQIDTHVVDSLQEVLVTQEGREKVKTMLELTWEFYDISFDDCIDWGEKAVKEAYTSGLSDLEAKANYVLGIQYAHHADLDLAKDYLRQSYALNKALADTANMFEALWSMATYELIFGAIDSSNMFYDKALPIAEQRNDKLSCAYIYANKAIISYKKGDFVAALDYNFQSVKISNEIGMKQMEILAKTNIATIYSEIGKPQKARKMFEELLPDLEAEEDYYVLQNICKNIGSLYAHEIINYDSAMHYFEMSMYYADYQVENKADQGLMRMLKSDVLSEMAYVSMNRGDNEAALKGYTEALALAEKESHLSGQMMAYIGLGTVYARLGQAKKSIHYFDCFSELEAMTGSTRIRASIRVPLVLDYARLGHFGDMEKVLRDIDDERAALVRENADLYDRNRELEDVVANLMEREEQQDAVLEAQQARLHQYKLIFFGSLGIVLALLLGWVAARIIKQYFARHANNPK